MSVLGFLAGMFSSDTVVNSATKIVDKIAGTDGMTPAEKAQFILDYKAATKHESVARRVIAFSLTALYVLNGLLYMIFTSVGKIFSLPGFHLAGVDLLKFLESSLSNPFNIVLIFYFTVQIANGLKK